MTHVILPTHVLTGFIGEFLPLSQLATLSILSCSFSTFYTENHTRVCNKIRKYTRSIENMINDNNNSSLSREWKNLHRYVCVHVGRHGIYTAFLKKILSSAYYEQCSNSFVQKLTNKICKLGGAKLFAAAAFVLHEGDGRKGMQKFAIMAIRNEYETRCMPWRRTDTCDNIANSRKEFLTSCLWALWYPGFNFEISMCYSAMCRKLRWRRYLYHMVVQTFLTPPKNKKIRPRPFIL